MKKSSSRFPTLFLVTSCVTIALSSFSFGMPPKGRNQVVKNNKQRQSQRQSQRQPEAERPTGDGFPTEVRETGMPVAADPSIAPDAGSSSSSSAAESTVDEEKKEAALPPEPSSPPVA